MRYRCFSTKFVIIIIQFELMKFGFTGGRSYNCVVFRQSFCRVCHHQAHHKYGKAPGCLPQVTLCPSQDISLLKMLVVAPSFSDNAYHIVSYHL